MKTSVVPENPKAEKVAIAELKPHPRNYRIHPEDQIQHLMASIKQNGFYRNVVIAKDNTILAGHGVVVAAKRLNFDSVPVIRLDLEHDDPRALKVVTGDNEIAHLGEIDDRALSEILKEIKDIDIDGLLGTGYDEQMLANLVFVTRPAGEIKDFDEAAEWAGMPEYDAPEVQLKLVVVCATEADRENLVKQLGINITKKIGAIWATHYPPQVRFDQKSVAFEE